MFHSSRSIELNNLEIVTIVLFLLDGDTRPIHEEDVAIKCYELFPEKFSWKKYPQYPDKMTPLFALEAGRKSEYGNVIEGNTRRGFILTSRGLEWLEKNQKKVDVIEALLDRTKNVETKISLARRAKGTVLDNRDEQLRDLRDTEAYRKYIQGKKTEVDVYDFHRFMGINEYVPRRKYEERLQAIRVLTEKDAALKEFVEYLNSVFAEKYRKP